MLETIYTVIVNWNLREDTLVCIRSLFAAGVRHGQVILVDNGSSDGSAAAVRTEFAEKVIVLETGENLGLAGGINVGLREALRSDAEWIFILNNDTVLQADIFKQFAEAAAALPDVAIWGPQIFYHADPERIWFLGERRVGGTLLGRRINLSDRLDPSLKDPIRVDFISGCAMLVRREVFDSVGGFDPTFFLFAEEVDFCTRAARSGFKLAAAPAARLLHKVSLSTDRDRPKSRFYRIRNQIWFYRRYAGVGQRVVLFAFTFLRMLRLLVTDLIRRNGDLVPPLVNGWVAGWFSPRGEYGFLPERVTI